MICTHGRTAATCEECAYERGVERGSIPASTPLYPAAKAKRPRADTDLTVDVGEGRTVRVNAGDLIPLGLITAVEGMRTSNATPAAKLK